MIRPLIGCLLLTIALVGEAQKPKDGEYTYKILFAEHQQIQNITCTVLITKDSIKIFHNGTKNLSGKKGDLINEGILAVHFRTKKWIVSHNPNDKYAKEIGGCTDGPMVVALKNKIVWLC